MWIGDRRWKIGDRGCLLGLLVGSQGEMADTAGLDGANLKAGIEHGGGEVALVSSGGLVDEAGAREGFQDIDQGGDAVCGVLIAARGVAVPQASGHRAAWKRACRRGATRRGCFRLKVGGTYKDKKGVLLPCLSPR